MLPCRVYSGSTSLFSIMLVWLSLAASAQQGQHPAFENIDSVEVWFDRIVGPEGAAITSGPEYRISFKGLRTHPFFLSPESDRSFVLYDNDLYRRVDLLYDSYSDA